MKIQCYNRSDILSFYDLTDTQQKEVLDDDYSAREQSYVLFEHTNGKKSPLSLEMFMRQDGRYHGIHGLSYFSAYGIILSRDGSQAVIAYLTW